MSRLNKQETHGYRACYSPGGCRCALCREANRLHNRKCRERHRKLVDATPAREHLKFLTSLGVGRRAVADTIGMNESALQKIRKGQTRRIQPVNLKKILDVGVEAAADGARINPVPTRRMLRKLMKEGFTKRELARRLNRRGRLLRIASKKRVTARNAMKVQQLYDRVMAE